jgi:hypothetical protein
MKRKMIQTSETWGCSDCAWLFIPSPGPPVGRTFEEMKDNFRRERDSAFARHNCRKYPRLEKCAPLAS